MASVYGAYPNDNPLTGQIIPAALHYQHLTRELGLQLLERTKIRANILPDSGMRAATRLNGHDALGRKGAVGDEEFLVFTREDVVGYDGYCVWRSTSNKV